MKTVQCFNIVIAIAVYVSTLMPSLAMAFPGEARSYFNDWLVVCEQKAYRSQAYGKCRASTSLRDKRLFPYGDGTLFQATLQRDNHSGFFIEFYHTLSDSYPSNKVEIAVDDLPSVSLVTSVEGNLASLSHQATLTLLPQLKAGRWLYIRYKSQQGKAITIKLSLRGITASLLFIDLFYNH